MSAFFNIPQTCKCTQKPDQPVTAVISAILIGKVKFVFSANKNSASTFRPPVSSVML